VRNKAAYLALGVLPDGTRDILGLWIESAEGAKFWMKVFNDLKTRGVADILIAVTDGLKGMGEALAVVYPATTLQTCIVHLIRGPALLAFHIAIAMSALAATLDALIHRHAGGSPAGRRATYT
jgi:transposase-like protein